MMLIGTAQFTLKLHSSQNLKAKRKIIKSLIDKLRHHYPISIAEIENLDKWQLATIGLAYVHSDPKLINKTLDKIIDTVINNSGDYEIIDHNTDILAK